jgi:DNA-binding MarR family transcriptional regulator
MSHAADPDPVTIRLREGFERIALVMRAESWTSAGEAGINPIQAQVLALLTARPAGLRPKQIAAHLAVSAPSIADTLSALERKGLLERSPDPTDARAVIARATRDGRELGRRIAGAASTVTAALAQLSPAEQAELLLTQMKLIRTLQLAGAIPMQRMCVSCRHFRPNAHPGAGSPHHCAFVDAPIGIRDLRLDCGEHEAAEPAVQFTSWAAFEAAGRSVTP